MLYELPFCWANWFYSQATPTVATCPVETNHWWATSAGVAPRPDRLGVVIGARPHSPVPALLFTSPVALGELLNLSRPLFSYEK